MPSMSIDVPNISLFSQEMTDGSGERWSQFINQEVDMVVLTLGMVTVGAMIAISMQRHV
jgi:hypothetical protein